MAAYVFNPSAQEVEKVGLWEFCWPAYPVPGQPGSHSKTLPQNNNKQTKPTLSQISIFRRKSQVWGGELVESGKLLAGSWLPRGLWGLVGKMHMERSQRGGQMETKSPEEASGFPA